MDLIPEQFAEIQEIQALDVLKADEEQRLAAIHVDEVLLERVQVLQTEETVLGLLGARGRIEIRDFRNAVFGISHGISRFGIPSMSRRISSEV